MKDTGKKMYAIVKDRGNQLKVRKGEVVNIDSVEVEKGDIITFDEVAYFTDKDRSLVGTPKLENVKVTAQVLDQVKGDKIIVFKMKRRKRYRRKQGHRQKYTKVKITDIIVDE